MTTLLQQAPSIVEAILQQVQKTPMALDSQEDLLRMTKVTDQLYSEAKLSGLGKLAHAAGRLSTILKERRRELSLAEDWPALRWPPIILP